MGIQNQIARLLLREHKHRPFTGRLLSIGRQTVHLTPAQAVTLVEEEVGSIAGPASDIDRATRGAEGRDLIADHSFYALFSDAAYHCLDVSDYEGADIVCNLCAPTLPAHLEGQFDFIYDGSCLDNMFDPAGAMRNLTRLLAPNGRILHVERASRRHNVYVAFALSWFHDYYAINGFEDCQVYLAQWDGEDRRQARLDLYHYRPIQEFNGALTYFGQDRYYYPWREAHVICIAEKSVHSTWDQTPIQFEYRASHGAQAISANADDPYVSAALRFSRSSRPLLPRPDDKVTLPDQHLHYAPEIPYCGSVRPL